MKNKYIIVKHLAKNEVEKLNTEILYYNGMVTPIFTCKKESAEIFTNKQVAIDKMNYANKYASGSELLGNTEIVKL